MKQKSTRESPVVVEDNDDDVSEVVQPATRNDATAKVTLSQPTNGKPAFKPKGKGKAGLSTNGHKNGTNGTEFVVIDEQDDDHPPPTKPLPSAKKGKSPAASTEEGAYSRELEKLREERDLVRLSNISVQVLQGYSTSSCSTRKNANSYPKASSSSYSQEIRGQRRSSYPVKLNMKQQAEVNNLDVPSSYLPDIGSSARGAYPGAEHSDFSADPRVEGRTHVYASFPHA
jgi:hypothetical protein